jgi:protocatechuate 3,4-dioxygenase beta subunit
MRCRQNFRRVQTIATTLIAAALIQTICAARLSADDPPEEPATPTTRANPRPASGAKGAATRAGQQLNRFDRQADTLDDLKSAMDGYTDYKTFTCTGQVRDALYNKPIEGAKVTILKLASPQRYSPGDAKVLKRIEATTDADGKYTFTLPTDHAFIPQSAAESAGFSTRAAPTRSPRGRARVSPYIPLEIGIEHPDYAATQTEKSVYLNVGPAFPYQAEGFSMPAEEPDPALRNVGDIELRLGKEVTGVLQSAEGKPLAGVKIVAHSQVPKNERDIAAGLHAARSSTGQSSERYGSDPSQEVTKTDDQGHFRVVMITPGEGMLEILPMDGEHAQKFEFLYDKRGDLGVIKLPRGQVIQGRVLDSGGKPLARVFISVRPWKLEPKYSGYGVSVFQHPQAAAESDDNGNFTIINALPTGDYVITPTEDFVDPSVDPHDWPDDRPVPGLFVQQKVTIVAGKAPPPLEIRALSTVSIEGRLIAEIQAAGNPNPNAAVAFQRQLAQSNLRQTQIPIQGKLNDWVYCQRIKLDEDGSFKAVVPKGMSDVQILLPSTFSLAGSGAAFQALSWRIGKDGEFHTDPQIDLGTLNADVRDIEIDFSRSAGVGGRGGFGGPARGFGGAAAAAAAADAPAGGFGGGGRTGGAGGAGNPAQVGRRAVLPARPVVPQPAEDAGGADGN